MGLLHRVHALPRRGRAVAVLAAAMLAAAAARGQPAPTYADVAPLLQQKCVVCHAGPSAARGLRLDTLEGVLKGSERGPVVKARDPLGSELMRRVKGLSLPRMPMTGPPFLADAEIATLERWVAGGLVAGDAPPAAAPAAAASPARPRPGEPVTWLHVAPIFATRCAKCHADQGLMGAAPEGLRLTSHEAALSAADRARIVPGQPGASELLRRIRGQARPRMPFDGPPWLGAEEIRLVEEWIAQGARNAEGAPAALPVGADVRLHGTLEAGHRLDGLALQVGPRTRIDKNPSPGDYVQVRGRLDARGSVVVERLRRR